MEHAATECLKFRSNRFLQEAEIVVDKKKEAQKEMGKRRASNKKDK
jgi:hypothetical protein